MICVSAVYENLPGSRFDGHYYLDTHRPWAGSLLAPAGLQAIRVTLGLAALDGTPPPYWAISEMLFTDRVAFDAAMAEHGAALFANAANYTDVTPRLQLSERAAPLSTGDD